MRLILISILVASCCVFVAGQPGTCDPATGEVWNDCGSACTKTCQIPDPVCTEQCVARCECPADKPLMHNGICIALAECPCYCKIYGDPHYDTFDNNGFSYQGTGTFLAAATLSGAPEKFKISHKISSKPGWFDVTFVHRVYFKFPGNQVRLGAGNILVVNGVRQPIPWTSPDSSISVTLVGSKITLTTTFGLIVVYDFTNYCIFICLPGGFRNLLQGMCGNCNGNRDDDLLLKGGEIPTGDSNNQQMEIGNSYANVKTQLKGNLPTQPFVSPSLPSYVNDRHFCGFLLPGDNAFTTCLAALGDLVVKNFLKSCQLDVAVGNDSCLVLNAVVETCRELHIAVNATWRALSNCPMTCDSDRVYSNDAPRCGKSCEDPTGLDCDIPVNPVPLEACVCPDTIPILHNGVCIPAADCN